MLFRSFYSLGYCKPSKTINRKILKEFLQGEDFRNSVYTVECFAGTECFLVCNSKSYFLALDDSMFFLSSFLSCPVCQFDTRKEQPCKIACRVKLDAEAAKNFKEKIHDDYRVNM